MNVYPPHYGCSCRPTFWNFARNTGYSQAISDGEMRWLRLYTQPIFISHQIYIYKRCLTTFMGPRGASLCWIGQQTPRGALLRWDLAWAGNWSYTYSYVISTRSRKSRCCLRRPRYGSTKEFICRLLGLMVLDFRKSLDIFPNWKNFLIELMVLGFKTLLDIFPIWKNYLRNNLNSFVELWIIEEVSPILITPDFFF